MIFANVPFHSVLDWLTTKINIPRRMRHDSHTVHSVYEPARLSVVSLVAWSDDEASVCIICNTCS
mgnify:CR=1 FL=1